MKAQTAVDLPIYQISKHDRGLFGYERVDFTLVTGSLGSGWDGDCRNPGWSSCKPPGVLPDPVDNSNAESLYAHAMIQIMNGIRNGSKQEQVQVNGESFLRVYSLTWTSTDVIRRPEETVGDGQSIQIDVTRTDI